MIIQIPFTDLQVSSLCLGTGEVGSSLDQQKSSELLDLFLELGGNFLDTAHVYGDWVPNLERSASEKTIGRWMRERGNRESIVLATKGAHWHFDAPEKPRLSRDDIRLDVEESLTSLQTDRIDLYWLHRDDRTRMVEEILTTLEELVAEGKIRYYGASNWKADRLQLARKFAESVGIQGFSADQPFWNAAVMAKPPFGDESLSWMNEELYAFHQESGMAVIPYQSQAYGLFNRMHNGTLEAMNPGFRDFYDFEASARRYELMTEIMRVTRLTITQVVLGYLRGQSMCTIPIIGCRRPDQLKDSMTALDVVLSFDQVKKIG